MIDNLPSIALREPWWLLLAPLAWALCLWWRHPDRWRHRLHGYADPHLLKWLIVDDQRARVPWLTLTGWTLIVMAISGPWLVDQDREAPRPGLDIAMVVDISPSMLVEDVAPNRLQRARLELDDFLHRLEEGDRVTLIAFSAHAYRLMPLTTDTALVSWYLEALDPSLTRHQGSNVIPALELAARTLGQSPAVDNRAVLLISDGEFPDADAVRAAAERLAGQTIPLFALGIGTATGAPVPTRTGYLRDDHGETVISRLDRPLLQAITSATGGRYSDLQVDDSDQDRLFAGLDRLARDSRPLPLSDLGTPLFPWLLALGLGLLIAGRLPRARPVTAGSMIAPVLPVLLLTTGLLLAPVDVAGAAPWSAERQAWAALQRGDAREAERHYRAVDGYRGRLGEGAALYRQQRWAAALAAFDAAAQAAEDDEQRARAVYNAANALARLDRLEEAMAGYDRALALQPNHARAAMNRGMVQRALEQSLPAPRQDDDSEPTESDQAAVFRPGLREDDRAAGETIDSAPAEPQPGITGPPAQRRVIGRPRPGDGAPATLSRFDIVDDDAREVLLHRFTLMDAMRPRAQETQPW